MDKIKVKVRPAGTNVKIQYEGEELTIKELVGKLEYLKGSQEYLKWAFVEREKEIALLKKQLAEAQAVKHGRWIIEDEYYVDDTYICSVCGYEFIITAGDLESNELNYCPRCGAKMDDKDINVPTKSGMEGKTMDKISREQVEKVWRGEWIHDINNRYGCSKCMARETVSHKNLKPYCPNCGAPMTDEAVDLVMQRLEALQDEVD